MKIGGIKVARGVNRRFGTVAQCTETNRSSVLMSPVVGWNPASNSEREEESVAGQVQGEVPLN